MTVHLNLPKDVEERLLAEVGAGRYATVEEAILEKVSRSEEPDLLSLTGMDATRLGQDLEEAWTHRGDTVDGEAVFARLAAKSSSRKAEGL
jgi:Arc/MetJ-type ribon-helix-helix transcriptional regulator